MDRSLQRQEPFPMGDRRHDSVDPELLDPDDSLVIAAKKQGGFLGRVKLAFLKAYNYLIRLHGSPEHIARGFAIGLFIAMVVPVGAQMAIAVLIATALRVNSPAAAAGCWLTNPLTLAPAYALNVWLGATLLGFQGNFVVEAWTYEVFLNAGRDFLISFFVGGAILGTLCAAISYYPTIYLVRAGRKTLDRRRARRAARRAARAAKKNKS